MVQSAAVSTSIAVRRAGLTPDLLAERPNILIFMPDQQQGATVLPGHPCLTPHLDRFASEGVLFSNAFCTAPHCCPSRASFMTGLYPSEHGVYNNVSNEAAIHSDPYAGTTYFSQALRGVGYQLGYSGKWHVGRNVRPEDAGWTNLFPGHNGQSFEPNGDMNSPALKRAKAEFSSKLPRNRGQVLRPGWGNRTMYTTLPSTDPGGYGGLEDYEVVQRASEGIRSFARNKNPWCIMASNSGGHDLYNAPKNFVEMYDPAKIELPPNFRDVLTDKPRIYQRMRFEYFAQMSDNEVRECIAHYWAKLTLQDALFGLLLDALDQSGQADNTLVLYVSDHGDYAGAHGLWAKGVPAFREGYNIPCVVRWPAKIMRPGRQVDALVSCVDFAPTILDAVGVQPLKKMSGSSFVPWLRDQKPAWRSTVFCQLNGVELYYTQRTMITHDFKYVYNGFDFDELYDLKNDPHEIRNLAFPDVAPATSVVERGVGLNSREDIPWPPLGPKLNAVRHDLLQKMWHFAREHNDQIFDSYVTTAMAPLGPAIDL